jgi:hypothetical protein
MHYYRVELRGFVIDDPERPGLDGLMLATLI